MHAVSALIRRWWRQGAAIALTALFVAWGMAVADLWAATARLASVGVGVWTVVVALAVVTVLLRWLRLALAVGDRPGYRLLRASALHGAGLALLPGKLGEAVLPVALNRIVGMKLAAATGLLILLRVYDLLALALVVTVALAVLALTGGDAPAAAGWIVGGAAAALAILALPLVVAFAWRLVGRPIARLRRLGGLLATLAEGALAVTAARGCAIAAATLALWLAIVAAFAAAAAATGLAMPVAETTLGAAAASLVFALPVNGVANVGPFEAAFAGVADGFGHSVEAAIATAVMVHLAAAATAVAVALLVQGGHVLCGSRRLSVPAEPPPPRHES